MATPGSCPLQESAGFVFAVMTTIMKLLTAAFIVIVQNFYPSDWWALYSVQQITEQRFYYGGHWIHLSRTSPQTNLSYGGWGGGSGLLRGDCAVVTCSPKCVCALGSIASFTQHLAQYQFNLFNFSIWYLSRTDRRMYIGHLFPITVGLLALLPALVVLVFQQSEMVCRCVPRGGWLLPLSLVL